MQASDAEQAIDSSPSDAEPSGSRRRRHVEEYAPFELGLKALGCDEAFGEVQCARTRPCTSRKWECPIFHRLQLCAECLLELQSRCARHRF